MTLQIERYLSNLPKLDREIASGVRDRSNQILRPVGALARLDEIAIFIASWQQGLAGLQLDLKFSHSIRQSAVFAHKRFCIDGQPVIRLF